MPQPELTVSDYLQAAERAVKGLEDRTADFVRGSDYESLSGPCALIWARESRRDTDLFRAIRFNDATGDDLTNLVQNRYGIARILDTRGQGQAILTRPTGGIGETIWAGTRIQLSSGAFSQAKYYRVTADTVASSTAIAVVVPIESVNIGPGSAIDATSGFIVYDTLVDPTWGVASLQCADGTLYEEAGAYRDRVRQTRRNDRVGHLLAIQTACVNAGAANAAILQADYGGDALDDGLNFVYVGDSGYSATASLVRACKIALRSVRVLGDHMQVLPMAKVVQNVVANITLADSPAKYDLARLQRVHIAALQQQFGGTAGTWAYTRVGLVSAIARPTPEVQDVSIATPVADGSVLVNGNFPLVLNRYALGSITLNYSAP